MEAGNLATVHAAGHVATPRVRGRGIAAALAGGSRISAARRMLLVVTWQLADGSMLVMGSWQGDCRAAREIAR